MPSRVVLTKPQAEVEDWRALTDDVSQLTDDELDAMIADPDQAQELLRRLARIVRTLARRAG